MTSRQRLLCAGLLALLAAGCERSGPAKYQVAGTVRWNGEPVQEADAIFVPVDRAARAEATKVAGGKFGLRLPPGKMRVQIFARRQVPGKIDPAMHGPVYEFYLPPQFNVRTTLEANVEPRDTNQWTFDLKRAN